MWVNTMKVFPNGLNIVTKEGKELKFIIGKRNSWSKALNQIY